VPDEPGGSKGTGHARELFPCDGLDESAGRDQTGRSARLKEKAKEIDPEASQKRGEHQAQLTLKKMEAAKKKKG
jgi:hypothetical protein